CDEKLRKIRSLRANVARLLGQLEFSEHQMNDLIETVARVAADLGRADRAVASAARRKDAPKAVRELRTRLRDLEAEHLTTASELDRILILIEENKREMARAKDEFVRANLRLVLSIAKNYSYPGLDLLDLVQEGNIGLMKAVDKFNYRLGHKFSTYATWW